MELTTKVSKEFVVDAHIALGKDELVEYVKGATDHLVEHVELEGFRKGKVPRDVAEKNLNPNAVRQEALELALEGSFSKAVVQEKWDVIRTAELKIEKNDADGLAYAIKVWLWPAVALNGLDKVAVPRKEVVATEQEIADALDTVLNMRSTFLDKTGAAAVGDRLEVDFEASIAGVPIEGGQSKDHPLIIGGKNFMPGFEEALVGLSSGQAKQFTLTAPTDYYEPKLAGKAVDFAVTINRVQAVLKPAADDAFAKSISNKFETLDELKASLREGIVREKEGKEQQRLRLAILDAIIATSEVPTTAELVKQELDDMVRRFSDDLQGRGLELSMYLARLNKNEEQLRSEWQKEAERQVRIMLVLRQVARDQNITVTPDELENAVKDAIADLMKTGQIAQEQVDPERIRSAIAQRILTDKTLEHLERTYATA